MEYISIDIETTGLDRENDQVLEIGAIIENTFDPKPFDELPKFHAIILHPRYEGSSYAINMNKRIFQILAQRPYGDIDAQTAYDAKYNIIDVDNAAHGFYWWCLEHLVENKPKTTQDKVNVCVAGKNYTDFDKPFLHRLPNWNTYFNFHRRVLDPATLYWKPMEDKKLPDLTKCLERAGIEDTEVEHHAVIDAWQVIQVLRGGNDYGND